MVLRLPIVDKAAYRFQTSCSFIFPVQLIEAFQIAGRKKWKNDIVVSTLHSSRPFCRRIGVHITGISVNVAWKESRGIGDDAAESVFASAGRTNSVSGSRMLQSTPSTLAALRLRIPRAPLLVPSIPTDPLGIPDETGLR